MAVKIPGVSPYTNSYAIKFPNGDIQLERSLQQHYEVQTTHTVKEGETIQSIAFQYYGDSGMWAIIADANNILNPFEEVVTDLQLLIPLV